MERQKQKVVFLAAGGFFLLSALLYAFSQWGSSGILEDIGAVEEELRKDIEGALASKIAIQLSIAKNENRFSCLELGGDHCSNRGGLFYLYKENSLLLSQIAPEKGLSISKEPCSNFPSKDCIFRIESEWQNIADNERCETKHPIKMSARLLVSVGSGFREWKTEKTMHPNITLSQRALCECEGKDYAYGSCKEQLGIQERGFASLKGGAAQTNRALGSNVQGEINCPDLITYEGQEHDVSNRQNESKVTLELDSRECESGTDYVFFVCNAVSGQKEGTWKFQSYRNGCDSQGSGRTEEIQFEAITFEESSESVSGTGFSEGTLDPALGEFESEEDPEYEAPAVEEGLEYEAPAVEEGLEYEAPAVEEGLEYEAPAVEEGLEYEAPAEEEFYENGGASIDR